MISEYLIPIANHLWQTTLFVTLVWVLAVSLRKNSAGIRYRLWMAASIKFLLFSAGGDRQQLSMAYHRAASGCPVVSPLSRSQCQTERCD